MAGGFLLQFELHLNIEVIVRSYQRPGDMQCVSETKDRTKTDHLLWTPQHLGADEGEYGNFKKNKKICICCSPC